MQTDSRHGISNIKFIIYIGHYESQLWLAKSYQYLLYIDACISLLFTSPLQNQDTHAKKVDKKH